MSAVEDRVRAAGLVRGQVVVLLSGGRDSVCLLDLAARLAGPATALHVNYGLRDSAGDHLAFEPIGEVKLKGFRDATDLFLARPK